MTAAKLVMLKKRIDSFQTAATKPRQTTAAVSGATKQLEGLFAKLDTVLIGRLDKLVVQFKESQPSFFNEYQAARRIVDPAGGAYGQEREGHSRAEHGARLEGGIGRVGALRRPGIAARCPYPNRVFSGGAVREAWLRLSF